MRQRTSPRQRGILRKQTVARKSLTREVLARFNDELAQPDDVDDGGTSDGDVAELVRPVIREQCRGGARPCPWVSCKHNLYLDVNPETGSITFNWPDLEPHEMPAEHSCALDSAEAGGLTLEEVGWRMNLTRERVRQLEVRGALKMRSPLMDQGVDSCQIFPESTSSMAAVEDSDVEYTPSGIDYAHGH